MSLKINVLLLISFVLISLLSILQTTSSITHTTQKHAVYRASLISDMAEKARHFNITSIEKHSAASPDIIIEQTLDNEFSCTFFKTEDLSDLFSTSGCNVKYAALSPINPDNTATDFEKTVITAFSDKQQNSSSSGLITIKNRDVVYLAKPITYQEACTSCHMASPPSDETSQTTPENKGHYYMRLGMPAAAMFTYVPYERVPGETSHRITVSIIKIILPILFVFVTLKVLILLFIEKPILRLHKLSNAISRGDKLNIRIVKNGTDEISDLFVSLNRIRRATKKFIKLAKKG